MTEKWNNWQTNFDCHWRNMENWVDKKNMYCVAATVSLLCRNLQNLMYRERGTPQTRYLLLSTFRMYDL